MLRALLSLALLPVLLVPAPFDALDIPRMELADVPVVPVRASEWASGELVSAGYGTVARFVDDLGRPISTLLLGAHYTGVFMRLPMLVEGDMITIGLGGEVLHYEVVRAEVRKWSDPELFNYDGMVLVTCTTADPLGVWAVFGRLVE